MPGMYEFFVLHLLDEGRGKIHLAGEKGLLLANREFVDRMNYMITTSVSSDYWGYEKSEVFMSLLERIDLNVSHDCWCSAMDLEYGGNAIVVSGNVQLGTSEMIFT
ncbi:unnamed protein product [Eruca vesicaria subsp. sativa]|uniref:Uncharacterized protein n=1 Tax=Eruca vesicaria subsp. sativa TaxID=29727 RepID=A0ABC8IY30_ERUVS|nr:unnamed protein product [Eruca vesicaria subsp. sativa]